MWTVRLWMEAEQRHVCFHPILKDAFARFGAREAYIELNLLLSILKLSAPRSLVIYPRDYPVLSEDEMLFLKLVSAVQHRREDLSHAALYRRIAADGADAAMPVLIRFATHLKAAGIWLLRPEGFGTSPAPSSRFLPARPPGGGFD